MSLVQKKGKEVANKPIEISKDIESTLPFLKLSNVGVFQVNEHFFSKSYKIPDINFDTLERRQQAEIGLRWAQFLGSFDCNTSIQISGYNADVDMIEFRDNTLMKYRNEDLDYYRDEYNEMLLNTMQEAKNNLETQLFLSITIPALDLLEAIEKFKEIDKSVNEELRMLCKCDKIPPMTTNERINLMYSIYNPEDELPLIRSRMVNGEEVPTFTLEQCTAQGIIPESVIGPDSLTCYRNYFEMGNKVGKSFYPVLYPTNLSSETISSFLRMPCNMLFSCHLRTMDSKEGIDYLKNRNTDIDANLITKQQKAYNKGYDPNLVNPELSHAKNDTLDMLEEVMNADGQLFLATMTITIFADNELELKKLEDALRRIASKKGFNIKGLNAFQKSGFNTSMPIGKNELPSDLERLLTTTSVVSLIPFNVMRLKDKGGKYYGCNAISKDINLIDRKNRMNGNMVIIGASGAGKSFATKTEMTNSVLDTPDDVVAIDPQGEYTVLAEAYHGTIIKLSVGSSTYINPFDLNIDSGDEDTDPVKLKADFIESLIDMMINNKWGLSSTQRSIITRCVQNIYVDYIQYCKEQHISIDRQKCPTLKDFYNELKRQRDPEAKELAGGIEKFVTSQDIFAHHTNVEVDNRFVVYNIKNIGSGLKEVALYILLDHIYNKMVENGQKNKWTWLYIDEFHTLLQKESAGEYVAQIWKKARQWKGILTAITQNVEDMLQNADARLIINNSYIVEILSQLPAAQGLVQKIFNIPQEEMQYITSGQAGRGILQIGEDLIPMESHFPEDTKLYKIMSTKPKEKMEVQY